MALASLFEKIYANSSSSGWIVAISSLILASAVYSATLHPVAHIPGKFVSKITSIPLWIASYYGIEASTLTAQHEKLGPVIRISPNKVSVSDGAALASIYSAKGGFKKTTEYAMTNFYIDGHATIFSELNVDERAKRAKPILPMFSTAAIRKEGWSRLKACSEKWVDIVESARYTTKTINILSSSRALALDSLCSYLFHHTYGGLDEVQTNGVFSADPFVNAFVAFGRFFYVPGWVFSILLWMEEKFFLSQDIVDGIVKVEQFVAHIIANATTHEKDADTYQARLLRAGITPHETTAQCKDVIFAGTDSTGMNLATLCFYLVKCPDKHTILRNELLANPDADPMNLPYLSAVVKEGLRISMANPTMLPRIVPASGITLPSGHHLPGNTVVGIGAHALHMNPKVFKDPDQFRPERWLSSSSSSEMLRDNIPFGTGSRMCIAKNLAVTELHLAVEAVVRRNVLEGAKCVEDRIRIMEWFNSRVVGEKIQLVWP